MDIWNGERGNIFLIVVFFLCHSCSSLFPIVSFSVECNRWRGRAGRRRTRQDEAGRNGTNAGGSSNAGWHGGTGGANGYVFFFLFVFFYSLLFVTCLLSIYLSFREIQQ